MPRLGEEEPQNGVRLAIRHVSLGGWFSATMCATYITKSSDPEADGRHVQRVGDEIHHVPEITRILLGAAYLYFRANFGNKCIMKDAYFDTFVFMLSNQNKGQKNGP